MTSRESALENAVELEGYIEKVAIESFLLHMYRILWGSTSGMAGDPPRASLRGALRAVWGELDVCVR